MSLVRFQPEPPLYGLEVHLAERVLGKDDVVGSIPILTSILDSKTTADWLKLWNAEPC